MGFATHNVRDMRYSNIENTPKFGVSNAAINVPISSIGALSAGCWVELVALNTYHMVAISSVSLPDIIASKVDFCVALAESPIIN